MAQQDFKLFPQDLQVFLTENEWNNKDPLITRQSH